MAKTRNITTTNTTRTLAVGIAVARGVSCYSKETAEFKIKSKQQGNAKAEESNLAKEVE